MAHRSRQVVRATNNGQAPPLPSIVSEMLKLPRGSERPQLTEESSQSLNNELWHLSKTPLVDEAAGVSQWHLLKMQDVCSRYPQSQIS